MTRVLTKLWRESEISREMVLASFIRIQIRGLASDFKACWLVSHQFTRRDSTPVAFPLNNDLGPGLLNHYIFSRSCSLVFHKINVQKISKKAEQKSAVESFLVFLVAWPCNFTEKGLRYWYFTMSVMKFLKTDFRQNTSRQLLELLLLKNCQQ